MFCVRRFLPFIFSLASMLAVPGLTTRSRLANVALHSHLLGHAFIAGSHECRHLARALSIRHTQLLQLPKDACLMVVEERCSTRSTRALQSLYVWMDTCFMHATLHIDTSGLHTSAQQSAAGTRST